MNVTITVDEEVLRKARELADRRGTTLNAMIRQYLQAIVVEPSRHETADELLALMRDSGGHSEGRTISRGEAYENRT